jgi:hypothetical protein
VIFNLSPDGPSPNALVASLRQTIKEEREEKAELLDELNAMRLEKTKLEQKLMALQSGAQVHRHPPQSTPCPRQEANGDRKYYTFDEVAAIFRQKLKKHASGQKRWIAFSEAQHALNPNLNVVTYGKITSWRKTDAFPAWAVEQLRAMPVEPLSKHQWSAADIAFLRDLHLADPHKSDEELARECSKQFGCPINTNSIKGKFNLLRRRGEIPPYRPKR